MSRTTRYLIVVVAGLVLLTVMGLHLLLSVEDQSVQQSTDFEAMVFSAMTFAAVMVLTTVVAVLGVLKFTRRDIPQWDMADRLHDYRVALYTWRFAESLGLDRETCRQYAVSAFLHDVGTAMIPTSILVRKGTLTEEEYRLVRRHVQFGTLLLQRIGLDERFMEIPRYHHEHYDGSGYQEGLKGDQIPLSAHMFALVDVFDVLVSGRPYKSAIPVARAKQVIQAEAGKQFDPMLCEHFLAHVSEWYAEIGRLDSVALREKVRHALDELFELSTQVK